MLLEEGGQTCVSREECPVKDQECPEGKIYNECGTACPVTCENKDDFTFCTHQCVAGEKNNNNNLQLYSFIQPQNILKIPLNSQKDVDIQFMHFHVGCFCPNGTVEKGDTCVAPKDCDSEVCSLSPEVGPCRAAFRRYFYNSTSDQCEQFIYGGCQGNDNNFETVEECEAKCRGQST